jgi:hypothetical protein
MKYLAQTQNQINEVITYSFSNKSYANHSTKYWRYKYELDMIFLDLGKLVAFQLLSRECV